MSKKRKHHRRKPLSADELERRRKNREERSNRKKKEKRLFWIKIAVCVMGIILLFAVGIAIDILYDNDAFFIYCSVLGVIGTTITDRSGLRTILFKHYPDHFLFSEYLKKRYPERSFLMELSRTVCYYAMCLMILWKELFAVWSVLCIMTMLIGYRYIIFDRNDEYTFDKFSKFSDTTLFLMFAGLLGIMVIEELTVPLPGIICGTIMLTVLYLIFSENEKKIELTFEVAIFSAMDILTAISLIKICF